MVAVLWTNSATWLQRSQTESSAIDTCFSRTHLNWPRFVELFRSYHLQQFQSKSSMNTRELKWLSLWQATAEYIQKIKARLFISCGYWTNDGAKFHYWDRRKKLMEELPSPSSGDMDIETIEAFQNSHFGYWSKNFIMLTSWCTGKKPMLIEDCWSNSSNLLPNHP